MMYHHLAIERALTYFQAEFTSKESIALVTLMAMIDSVLQNISLEYRTLGGEQRLLLHGCRGPIEG